MTENSRTSLLDIALFFLRLGFTAFGGPAVHIALMEDEAVHRRQWMTREKFLDLLGMANMLPGPSSTEMALFIGYTRAGWAGLVLAGLCFIAPAMLIVWVLAMAYVHYGHLPAVTGLLYGLKPVVIAVVLQALARLGRSALKDPQLTVLTILAALAYVWQPYPLWVLLGTGAAAVLLKVPLSRSPKAWTPLGFFTTGSALLNFNLTALFWFFLKMGCVVFGSGYVLFAFLHEGLVQQRHWLTEGQLLDAIAVGQVTPGPVFTTATFIGYLLGGTSGALIATAGVFLPAFLLVFASGPLLGWLRRSAWTGHFLDGINAGAVALIAVVLFHLGQEALIDPLTIGLGAISAFLLIRYQLNSNWVILAGALLGFILKGH